MLRSVDIPFDLEESMKLSSNLSRNGPFWIVMRALAAFVSGDGDGCLPLDGGLDDMTASSEQFIGLQNVYAEKAAEDIVIMKKIVQSAGISLDADARPYAATISDLILLFCKNS